MPGATADKFKTHKLAVGLLLLQFFCLLALNIAYAEASLFSLRNDSAIHAFQTVTLFWNEGPEYPYPKFFYALTYPLVSLLGNNYLPFLLMESLAVLGWAAGTYACLNRLLDRKCAFLGATLLLWSTQTGIAMRTFFMDYPLACAFTWQYYLFLRSRSLRRLLPSLGFALLIPVCLFLKLHYVSYAGALFLMLACCPASRPRSRRLFLRYVMLICAGFSLAISLHLAYNGHINLRDYYRVNVFSSLNRAEVATDIDRTEDPLPNIVAVLVNSPVFRQASSGQLQARLELARDWLSAYWLEIKCKLLLSAWPLYLLGLAATLSRRGLRRRLLPLLGTILICSLFFAAFTSNNTRYQAPLLAWRCALACAVFYRLKQFEETHPERKKLRLSLQIAALLLWLLPVAQGIIFNCGWMWQPHAGSQVPSVNQVPRLYETVTPSYVQNELLNNNITGNFFNFNLGLTTQGQVYVEAPEENSPANMLNLRSAYSRCPFFSMAPYRIDWLSLAQELDKTVRAGDAYRRGAASIAEAHENMGAPSAGYLPCIPTIKICTQLINTADTWNGDRLTWNPELTTDCEIATMLNFQLTRLSSDHLPPFLLSVSPLTPQEADYLLLISASPEGADASVPPNRPDMPADFSPRLNWSSRFIQAQLGERLTRHQSNPIFPHNN